MRNRTYGGVRGRKTKVGRKLLRFPPTRLQDKDESFKERTELAGALCAAPGLCAGAPPPARQTKSGEPRASQLVEIQPQTHPARQTGCPPHPTARPAQPHERSCQDGLELVSWPFCGCC